MTAFNQLFSILGPDKKTKKFFSEARKGSVKDVRKKLSLFRKEPSPINFILLIRSFTNSGAWLSHSALRLLLSAVSLPEEKKALTTNNSQEIDQNIINDILNDRVIDLNGKNSIDVFYSIYKERLDNNFNYNLTSFSSLKQAPTIVLVSGVFNEFFSTPAFERGAKFLCKKEKLKYFAPKVSGAKNPEHNSKKLKKQIDEYLAKNPNEKLWFVAFSKGGIDCLHFLKSYPDFSSQHILGLSTIATPILGSDRLNSKLLRTLNSIHKYSNNSLYQLLDKKTDLLLKDFQKSLNQDHQSLWFKENAEKLPKDIFYTALALESNWKSSHFWMKITKVLFKSTENNDGIVDSKQARFPSYFKGTNLGTIDGHHLIGTRSSFYNQEALIESLLIFLKATGKIS